jgi:hypothetical protein
MKNILEYNAQGATIRLDQRELLLVKALIQEGRESFGCNTVSGKALDDLFSMANTLVEVAHRKHQITRISPQKSRRVATLEPAAHKDASHDFSGNQMSWFKRL